MSIETDLKKEGIQIVHPLDTLTVNSIAKNVSEKLVLAFPDQNLDAKELFIKLSRLNMYLAKMPSDLSNAKYYYKNKSIYFNEKIDTSALDVYAIHECLHYLQELRDSKNNLIQLGLCDFTNSHLPGIALNEAAVQLMSAKSLLTKLDVVKYFDITLPTYSPSHYALECNLINQMAYITGDYTLYHSTLYSNSNFENKFILLTNKRAFYTIQNNIDKLMDLEEDLSNETSKLEYIEDTDKAISKIVNTITHLKTKIQQLFIATQEVILTSYFDAKFKTISTLEQIDTYRKCLYNYKDLIGSTENYSFFNNYYIKKMVALEMQHNLLENSLYQMNNNVSLIPLKHNLIIDLFKKIKKLFLKNTTFDVAEEYKKI